MDFNSLQPLITWLQNNPHWALLITLLVSFSESVAILGVLIPGSVTMTAIGILAGSGVMRIDLTLLAATLGAIAGDGVSYVLGHHFNDRLHRLWPFNKYPAWLEYGQEHFSKHGAKSVFIGRFIGPLRATVPVIAGMMRMNRWYFFLANASSAVLWSLLYVMPGVLIGAASAELSPESASRLFVLVLAILGIAWLLTLGLQWLFRRLHLHLRVNLRYFWRWSKKHPRLARCLSLLTPTYERYHYPTAILLVLSILSLSLTFLITVLVIYETPFTGLNRSVYLLLQSIHTPFFDSFFISTNLLLKPPALLAVLLFFLGHALFYQNWRMLRYWVALTVVTLGLAYLSAHFVSVTQNSQLLKYNIRQTYPDIALTLVTAWFSFLLHYTQTNSRPWFTRTARIILSTTLLLIGLSLVYLGDQWISSVFGAYTLGFTLGTVVWLLFRRKLKQANVPCLHAIVPFIIWVSSALMTLPFYFTELEQSHHPRLEQYILTHNAWWHQTHPLLPLYTTNRIGQHTGLFNIQYAGSIDTLKTLMEDNGWEAQPDSFAYLLLFRVTGQQTSKQIPLMAQLYHNRKPLIIMTRALNDDSTLILRLWRSNYHLRDQQHPIWLGSILVYPNLKKNSPLPPSVESLLPKNDRFQFKTLSLPSNTVTPLRAPIHPIVLLIKETPDSESIP